MADIQGTDADETLEGTDQNDTIDGGGGNDILRGGPGRDTLIGGAGDDLLIGGPGDDYLIGGDGYDQYEGVLADIGSYRDSNGYVADGDQYGDIAIGEYVRISDVALDEIVPFRLIGGSDNHFAGIELWVPTQRFLAQLTFTTYNLRPVLRADATGGTDLVATNRYTGLNDFDGNGHSDLLWRNADGRFSTWEVSGNGRADQLDVNHYLNNERAADWRIVETFDFNGDGISELLRHNVNTGAWSVGAVVGTGFDLNRYGSIQVGADWNVAGVGDVDGNGLDDIVWRQDGGAFSLWLSFSDTGDRRAHTNTVVQNAYFDNSVSTDWQIVGLGDFDGDGRDDLMWRNQADGAWSIWTSTGRAYTPNPALTGDSFTPNTSFVTSVDQSWHVDGLGDFDGDGRDDILWRHDGDGIFSIWQSTGTGFLPNAHVDASVSPNWRIDQVADFNADGRADILWRNTDTGEFSTWQSNGHGFDANVVFVGGVGVDWQVQAHDYHWG